MISSGKASSSPRPAPPLRIPAPALRSARRPQARRHHCRRLQERAPQCQIGRYVEQGGTGIYLKALLQRLGIADALKDKVKLLPPEHPAANAVANGEAEIGMTQISEILPYTGAELVGPFPKEIQLTTSFAAAVGANARQPEAANALIKFLTAPSAAPVFKAKGLDPAG